MGHLPGVKERDGCDDLSIANEQHYSFMPSQQIVSNLFSCKYLYLWQTLLSTDDTLLVFN